MVLCILLTIFLPTTTTEESIVPPPSDQETTLQPIQETPEAMTDAFNQNDTTKIASTTAEALKIVTPMATITPTLTTQKQTPAKLEAITVNATREPSSTEMSMSTHLAEGDDMSTIPDFATSPVQNAERLTLAISSSQSVTSSTVQSTSPANISSIQTSTTAPETTKVEVQPGRATTIAVPTAKLSATTEMATKTATSDQNATDFVGSIPSAKTTNLVPTESSATTQLVPIVQKTSAKVDQATRKTTAEESEKGVKHGKIVAGLIGGALLAMMIGFLLIMYKKHKLKKHQIATTEWAGPTPFLEAGGGGGVDNGQVRLRSASRISLTSFLPQRLSKRLSLLAESAEEMQDMQEMTVGTTFATKEGQNGVKLEQTSDETVKEADGNNSESSAKTDEVVLDDEVKKNEGEASKDKQNGQAVMKDFEKGQVENVSTPAQKESENGNKGEGEKDGGDNAV